MSERKRRGTGSGEKEELPLLKALQFVGVAQRDEGVPYQTHCRFANGYVIAFDGILAAGYPVGEEMAGCPQTKLLIEALKRVKGAYSLTLLDNHELAIVTADFRALVPCLAPVDIAGIIADAPNYVLDDSWKLAALEAGTLCTDGATTVLAASVLTQEHSVVGTNNIGFIERLHKGHTPPGLCIPMSFVKAVAKVSEPLTKFGFSDGSFTVYFESGAWLRTQLYQEQYPDMTRVFNLMNTHNSTPVPEKLFTAVEAVTRFSEDGLIYIDNDSVRSHNTPDKGAQHRCEGLPYQTRLNHKVVLAFKPFIKRADFMTHANAVVFYGEGVRGLIAKV